MSLERLALAQAARQGLRDRLLEQGVLLFGPGTNGRQAARALRAEAETPTPHAFISDVDVGHEVEGLPVLTREQALREFGPDQAIVNCVYRADVTLNRMMSTLRTSGFNHVCSLPHLSGAFAGSYPAIYGYGSLDLLGAERERIFAAQARLADDLSKRVFAELIAQRVTLDFSTERRFDARIYFPDFLSREHLAKQGEPLVFVDCGAYTGDTLQAFANWSPAPPAVAVALEPDPASFVTLERTAERLQGIETVCVPAAAGAEPGRIGFASLGNEASHVVADGSGAVELTSVDVLMAELGRRANYIKYDVEGFERDAIAGSREAIARDGAGLAVSVYHRPDDLWDLLLTLHALQPKYQFRLREHGPDGVDTVLYALASR